MITYVFFDWKTSFSDYILCVGFSFCWYKLQHLGLPLDLMKTIEMVESLSMQNQCSVQRILLKFRITFCMYVCMYTYIHWHIYIHSSSSVYFHPSIHAYIYKCMDCHKVNDMSLMSSLVILGGKTLQYSNLMMSSQCHTFPWTNIRGALSSLVHNTAWFQWVYIGLLADCALFLR